MVNYWLFLIGLGVASANGVDVPAWAWTITVILAFIGSTAHIVKIVIEHKEK